jgi:hypothetical protein
MLNPLPIGIPYLAPIAARLNQHDTITIADLCGQPPPEPEEWSFTDTLSALNQQQWPLLDAKLQRMVRAHIWGTYCEYTPPPSTVTYPQLVQVFFNDIYGTSNGAGGNEWYALHYAEPADMYCLMIWPITEPGGSNGHIGIQLGPEAPPGPHSIFVVEAPHAPGWGDAAPHQRILVPGQAITGDWTFDPLQSFRLVVDPDNVGDYAVHVSGWNLVPRPAPDPPSPWPAAPDAPPIFQFSQECAQDLCDMAAWLPNLQNHVINADLNTTQLLDRPAPEPWDVSITEKIDNTNARVNDFIYPITTLYNSVGGGFGLSYDAPETVTSGQIVDVTGSCGAVIIWTPGANTWTQTYGTPSKMHQAGFVTWGTDEGWYAPVDLAVSPQRVGGWSRQVTRLAVSLPPGGTAQVVRIYGGGLP